MAEPDWSLVLSCEHGGNLVPRPWQGLFAGREALLETHLGYDIGIAPFARRLARELRAPLQLAETTRLLVELNRSPGHPGLFSEFSKTLDPEQRQQLLNQYYVPYRQVLQERIAQLLAGSGRVCHLSLHSFTPELNGEVRCADVGLLYDPRRPLEQRFCQDWQVRLKSRGGGWRIRRNYPYRGTADGLVVLLRRRFPAERYLGIELELNQCWPLQGGARWRQLQVLIRDTLRETLAVSS